MIANEEKMYQVAAHLKDLNAKGKVKGIQANEKGYARIKDIVVGCTLLVHHLKNDKLRIELLITRKARTRNPMVCNNAIAVFEKRFGSDAKNVEWINGMDNKDIRDCYYVDATNKSVDDIMVMVNDLKNKCLTS